MDGIMSNVLQILDYAAPYRGNFIPSMEAIEEQYNSGNMVYLFPDNAATLSWMMDFLKSHRTYFMPLSFYGKRIKWSNLELLNEIIKKEAISIIHCHFVTYNYTLFFARYTIARHCKYICHIHNQFVVPKTKFAPLKRYIMRHLYDMYIGVSAAAAESVRAEIGKNNIIAIPNAVDFQRLDKYGLLNLREHEAQKVVLMAGWPAYVKGVDIAVRAVKQLREQGIDVVLGIMLSGDFDKTEKYIVETIGEMPTWCKLLPPREDVATYYNACDIFLSASRSEGFSYCIVEAAYCNLRIISSDIPGPNQLDIPDMVLFENENVNQLVLVLNRMFNNDKSINRSVICQTYDMLKWVKQMIYSYEVV